jgi:carboxyl-terminal processing protease
MLTNPRPYAIACLTALSVSLLTAPHSLVAVSPDAPSDAKSIEKWSEQVWDSARQGDRTALDRYLRNLPEAEVAFTPLDHFRDALAMHVRNRESSEAERVQKRDEALDDLQKHLDDGDLSKALRSAVEYQTLAERLEDAFNTDEVRRVIAMAESEIPKVKEREEWLYAQELLFRLRTLFEDTSRHADYQRFDEELNRVNHRVGLLSRYAPKRLHAMRNEAAVRRGDEPLGEFNELRVVRWQERVDSITEIMVREALRIAGSEHIEGDGWRPLLEGGLESLKLLATTSSLDENFASLGHADNVNRWVRAIDRELAGVRAADARDLDSWKTSQILGRIRNLNRETINLPPEVILREFADGAMQRLDQFSEIVWPHNLRRFRQQTEGNFVGVGILIRHNEKQEIVVVNPLEGTPAYFAGIKPDDVIAEVNKESTVGWSLNDAVDEITGPRGVPVTLGIRREGHDELLQFEIIRDTIRMHSVRGWLKRGIHDNGDLDWDWYIDPATRIGYIKLTSFNEDTFEDVRKAWREMNQAGTPNGLVVDLRYNPGGLLTSAVQVSNLFLQRGLIVSGENKDGVRAWQDRRARPNAAELSGIPTVVIINKGSASGSEIVAGALQAHGAAIIVGERSYGKGSVQTVHNIAPNAALKLTTQYYRLPPKPGQDHGKLVHRRPGSEMWGVDPDIVVPMSPHQVQASIELRQEADIIPEDDDGKPNPDDPNRPDVNDLLTKGLDPQLETALLILQARAMGTIAQKHRHAALDRQR